MFNDENLEIFVLDGKLYNLLSTYILNDFNYSVVLHKDTNEETFFRTFFCILIFATWSFYNSIFYNSYAATLNFYFTLYKVVYDGLRINDFLETVFHKETYA